MPEVDAERYIHGYGEQEEQRLRVQAAVLAPEVIHPLALQPGANVLEIGCGSGAELEQLLACFPGISLTGLELDSRHLDAAGRLIGSRARLVQGDAYRMPFADASFDAVLSIWVLEHLAEPRAAMREALRVLKPEGQLLCTEVDNDTMRFSRSMPAIEHWWQRLCSRQVADGGDPYVGRRLRGLAQALGCRDIRIQDVDPVSSIRMPERRTEFVDYLESLFLSGASRMLATGDVTERELEAVREEFTQVRQDADVQFEYHGVRLLCRRPA